MFSFFGSRSLLQYFLLILIGFLLLFKRTEYEQLAQLTHFSAQYQTYTGFYHLAIEDAFIVLIVE